MSSVVSALTINSCAASRAIWDVKKAFQSTEFEFSEAQGLWLPWDNLKFQLFALPGAVSDEHVDTSGLMTIVYCVVGRKLWILFGDDGQLYVIVLKPGDIL